MSIIKILISILIVTLKFLTIGESYPTTPPKVTAINAIINRIPSEFSFLTQSVKDTRFAINKTIGQAHKSIDNHYERLLNMFVNGPACCQQYTEELQNIYEIFNQPSHFLKCEMIMEIAHLAETKKSLWNIKKIAHETRALCETTDCNCNQPMTKLSMALDRIHGMLMVESDRIINLSRDCTKCKVEESCKDLERIEKYWEICVNDTLENFLT